MCRHSERLAVPLRHPQTTVTDHDPAEPGRFTPAVAADLPGTADEPLARFDDLILNHFTKVILQPKRLNLLLGQLRASAGCLAGGVGECQGEGQLAGGADSGFRRGAVGPEQLKLKDRDFAQRYLRLLVDSITVDQTTATLTGNYRQLTHAIVETKRDTSNEVPISMLNWRARQDSNPRPPGS